MDEYRLAGDVGHAPPVIGERLNARLNRLAGQPLACSPGQELAATFD